MGKIRAFRQKLLFLAILSLYVALRLLLGTKCPIQSLTNIPCPGCGMSRACLAILRGDFAAAIAFHAMVWSLPFLLLLFLFDGKLFQHKWANMLTCALIGGGFLANWLIQILRIV